MKLLAKIAKIYDRTIDIAAVFAGILVIFLMLIVGTEVSLRYFFGRPTTWTVEVAGYMMLYIAFLVVAWVLKRDEHVRMDLVITHLSPRIQSLVNTFTSIIGAIVFLLLTWFGVKATLYLWQVNYLTSTPLRAPKFIIVAVIFFGSFLLSMQFLRKTRSYLGGWRAPPEKEEKPIEKIEFRL